MDFVGDKIYKCGDSLSKIYKCGEVVWSADTEPDYSKMALTFEAEDPETFLQMFFPRAITFEYSYDGGENWTTVTVDRIQRPLWIDEDHKTFMIKANETSYNGTSISATTGPFMVYGNIMSLLGDQVERTDITHSLSLDEAGVFSKFFANCTGLTSAQNLKLPATGLTITCYSGMFSGCTNLVAGPEILPATALVLSCYEGMFYGCTSLTQAPELPATTLASYCYLRMFKECTSLIQAPALPATTLIDYCYDNMFSYCTSLTTAPALPATTLARYCYRSMFNGCTSLVNPPELPATTLANSCYYWMFKDCPFSKAPELLATEKVSGAYSNMFYNCTNLNWVKCMLLGEYLTAGTDWLYNVSPTGTFVKNPNSSWESGVRGIPEGWTVIEE